MIDNMENIEIKEKIEKLREYINYHSKKYHTDDSPEISDYDYDMVYLELSELEKLYPQYYDPNSPTQRVGGIISDGFEKVTHSVQMKSLTDVFSFDELYEFINKYSMYGDFSSEYKIDGLSVSLIYENGQFVRAATRGDGLVGEDVSNNIRTIKSIPLNIGYNGLLEIRGEVYMPKSSFNLLNEKRMQQNLPLFANPRNAAAGSLRQLDSSIVSERGLEMFAFNIQRCDRHFKLHSEGIDFIKSLGFNIIPDTLVTSNYDEIVSYIKKTSSIRNELEYNIDGIVVNVNDIEARTEIGENTNVPRWAVAYKFPPDEKQTKLTEIVINVGRTGVLTPTAVLDAVSLAGTTVRRATLHNINYIKDKDIRIGDIVTVRKAGDIIPEVVCPQISQRNGNEIPYEMPQFCPSCGEAVSFDEEVFIRCTNYSCPAQLERNIVHFASRGAMNIDGLGPAVVALLINKSLIKDISDIYYLKEEQLENLERMGKKSANNLIEAINKSKNNGCAKLLYALGIRQIGEKAAVTLSKKFGGIDRFYNLTADEISTAEDIGEISAGYIVDFFAKPKTRYIINRLIEAGVNTNAEIEERIENNAVLNKRFVITGTLPKMSRSEAEEYIISRGGKVSSSVSKKTDYVVAGSEAGKKLTEAQALNIKIINETELLELI